MVELTDDEFDRRVAELLRTVRANDAAEWTLDNATDMGGLGPADVAREEGRFTSPENIRPVAKSVLKGYRHHLANIEEEI